LSLEADSLRKFVVDVIVKGYGYDIDQVGFDVAFSEEITADAVIYREKEKKTPFITIEFKRHILYPIALSNLEHYMKLSHSPYGLLTNGEQKLSYKLVDNKIFKIPEIPKSGQNEKEVYMKSQFKTKMGLEYSFQKIRDHLEGKGLSNNRIISEIQKLVFAKIVDEESPSDEANFWISPKELSNFAENSMREIFCSRIRSLFTEVKKRYSNIFSENDRINLDPEALSFAVAELHDYSLTKIPADSFGVSYQNFVLSTVRSYLGEYYTSKTVARLMINLLDPGPQETIIDPACGTGGFLIESIRYIRENYRITESEKQKYPKKIYGIDINPQIVSIAKMNMALHNAAEAKIIEGDFLSPKTQSENILLQNFDVVITDPPFSGYVNDKKILKEFEIAEKRVKQRILILFIEKCLKIMKSGGRLAIVVPDALLSNDSLNYVRSFILKNAMLEAIVSLKGRIQFEDEILKSSIIILRKDYQGNKEKKKVFMAEIGEDLKASIDETICNYFAFKSGHDVSSKHVFLIDNAELGRRWDVSFHKPLHLDIKNRKYLDRLCLVIRGKNVPSKNYSDPTPETVPYVRISDMTDDEISLDRLKFVDRKLSGKKALLHDVLFSVQGTIGKIAIVNEDLAGCIVSSNIAILRPKTEVVLPKFLFRILASKAVTKQITQFSRNQFIPFIALKDLRRILVPYCSVSKQRNIVKRVEQLEEDRKKLGIQKSEVETEMRRILGEVGN
jgi:type I restriction enzyme M protein